MPQILFDARSLQDRERTGVGIYAHELGQALLARGEDVRFFLNAAGRIPAHDLPPDRIVRTRHPNRLLNASMRLFGAPTIESVAASRADVLFLPNANFVATKLPFVTTIHDLSFEHFPEFFTAKQRLWHGIIDPIGLARRAAAVVVVSNSTKRDLMKTAGIDPAKIVVASPGVGKEFAPQSDERIRELRAKYALPKKFLLFLAAIEPRKNVVGIIEAFDLADVDADLVIAGPRAWGWKEVEKAANKAKKRKRVRFLGYVPHADKPALYAAAHAFVYPSFYEGFGMPPLEAMACGTPVVASHAPSLNEIVADAGWLVNPDDARAIADGIEVVSEDNKVRNELRARGLVRAAGFTWERCADEAMRAIALATK